MFVTNTGTVKDTFDLSLGGPAALVSSLATDQVTLAPGKEQTLAITTNPANFAVQGALELTATATSEGNPNVRNSATAELNIASTQGMTAQFQEPTQVIPIPGTSDFLLLVNNTGNIQDSYSATITGTTGPVTASLTGLDGNPTQSIPLFTLPGLSTGAIILQTDLTGAGQGTVTVQVQSLSNPNETASATASVSTAATSEPVQPEIGLTGSPGSTTTYGQSVSFTATVGPPASGDSTPTGSVQFQIDGANFGSSVTLDDNGSATSEAISSLAAAGHTITALYSGDSKYSTGSQTLTLTVNPAMPTVKVSAPDVTYDAAPYNAVTSAVIGVNNANLGAASSFTYYVGTGTGGTALGSAAPKAAGTYTVVAQYYGAGTPPPQAYLLPPTQRPSDVYDRARPRAGQITSGGSDSLLGTSTMVDSIPTPRRYLPTPTWGFVGGDTQAVVVGAPSFSTPPGATDAAGVYPITVTQGTLEATNYVFRFVAGILTVHPKVTDVDIQWGTQTMSIMNLHRDLPFTDITAIDISFSDSVAVTKSDLTH